MLYRLFGADGELLYIGVTGDFIRRMHQHAEVQLWWDDVFDATLEYLTSRVELEAAERLAIIRERPRYNVQHRQSPRKRHKIRPPQAAIERASGAGGDAA